VLRPGPYEAWRPNVVAHARAVTGVRWREESGRDFGCLINDGPERGWRDRFTFGFGGFDNLTAQAGRRVRDGKLFSTRSLRSAREIYQASSQPNSRASRSACVGTLFSSIIRSKAFRISTYVCKSGPVSISCAV